MPRMSALILMLAAGMACAGCQTPTSPVADSSPVPVASQPARVATGLQAASADDLVPAKPSAAYPLKKCVVSGETLKSDRLVFTYKGEEVQFCCKDCISDFRKNPEKYLAQVRSARTSVH